MFENITTVATEISKLDPKAGDILLVKLCGDLDDSPWIPSKEDIDSVGKYFATMVPKDVKVYVTHQFVDVSIVSTDNLERVVISPDI